MASSSAILVELKGFLFEDEENFMTPSIMAWQKMDQEAKELLLETQEYSDLIGFYCCSPSVVDVIRTRLEKEGLKFSRMTVSTEHEYDKVKSHAVEFYRSKYDISCYIDETENSPWQSIKNLHRLKF